MKRHVLALNGGSSSLKYALFETDAGGERPLARASVAIGGAVSDHAAAVRAAFDDIARAGLPSPDATGHRIVHGGPELLRPVRVDGAVLAALRAAVPFAPLHLPAEIRAIEAARERFPDLVHVACFDTSFHRTMPDVAKRFALPRSLFDEGVRRYGFHGLSYEYVVAHLGGAELGRAVIAHLGSGASLCAVRDGRSVDTTMGLTPTGGVVMATRSGDLDPGLVVYLLEHGYDAASLERLVTREAGLLALSGTTGDMKRLVEERDRDPRAAFAVEAFAWHARKAIGALAASLGGIDTLVFTGGIGERAPIVRLAIARGLEHLGVRVDASANDANAEVVSEDGSPCVVRVVATDEERMVARHTSALLAG